MVHPASFYIAGRLGTANIDYWSPFVEKGKKISLLYALVDPDGAPLQKAAGPQTLKAGLYRVTWKLSQQQGVYDYINTRYERVEVLEAEHKVDLKAGEGSLSFVPGESGEYFIRLTAQDASNRQAVTDVPFYSTGADWVRWKSEDTNDIDLKSDKALYNPGETAKILIQSPLPEGNYLVTLEREGIFEERFIKLKGSARLIEVPLKDQYVPIVYVSVCSYSRRTREPNHTYFEPDLDKPKGYFGILPVRVASSSRALEIEIDPGRETYLPGQEAEVTLRVLRNGKPVKDAEVAFLAVDRGVLDLIDYHVPDPLRFFYSQDRFPLSVFGADSRSLLIDPVTYAVRDLYGGDDEAGKMEAAEAPSEEKGLTVRKDFRALAVFEPFLITDSNGTVRTRFTLPDTLTTYRLSAVAVLGDYYGIEESELIVQNPINVQAVFPRKLRLRDTAIANIIVTNLDKTPKEVSITLESGIIKQEGNTNKKVVVPGGSTLAVPFKLLAVQSGSSTMIVHTRSESVNERLETTLQVEKPSVFESFTTIGKTSAIPDKPDDGLAEEGLILPPNLEDDLGSLALTLNATRLASLKESINFLFTYPYGCFEQRTAQLLPLVLFGDYIQAFELDSEVKDVHQSVKSELAYWLKFQKSDGGFPFWPEGASSSYYVSLRVAHLIHFARQAGYDLPEGLKVSLLLQYLSRPANWVKKSDYLSIYSLYIRNLYGLKIMPEADRYFARGDAIGVSGYAFLGLLYAEAGKTEKAEVCLKMIKRFVRPGTQTLDLTDTYETGSFYNSQIEQLALFLMLNLRLGGEDEMVTRIVNTLLNRQKAGIWHNTADTNWAFQALAALMEKEQAETPDFHAAVEIAGKTLFETDFKGIAGQSRGMQFKLADPPLKELARNSLYPLSFRKSGKGILYYTATLRYAIPSEITAPRDEGIGIYYEIQALNGNTITGQTLELGTTYRVRAFISTPKRRAFVAVRLPVPSGAEILDASFVTTARYESFNQGETGDSDYNNSIVPIQKIMDNEVRYFFDDLPQGKQAMT
ncbi:MAG: alpha-2-macroglobulin family protein, partial [Spirochaetota bacterium]